MSQLCSAAAKETGDFLTQRNDLIEDTKRAIKVQADIARKADAAVVRLEIQLDNLLNFSK
jgi:hypothetical protein